MEVQPGAWQRRNQQTEIAERALTAWDLLSRHVLNARPPSFLGIGRLERVSLQALLLLSETDLELFLDVTTSKLERIGAVVVGGTARRERLRLAPGVRRRDDEVLIWRRDWS